MRGLLAVVMGGALVAAPAGAAEEPVAPPAAADAGRWEQLTQSADPDAQLTYASVMFYQARRLLRSDRERGTAMFARIEALLGETVRLTEGGNAPNADVTRSQAHFLLGQIAQFVSGDRAAAETHYKAALVAFPSHIGASQALGELLIGPALQQQPAP